MALKFVCKTDMYVLYTDDRLSPDKWYVVSSRRRAYKEERLRGNDPMTIPSINANSPNVKAARAAIKMFATADYSTEERVLNPAHENDPMRYALVVAPTVLDDPNFPYVEVVVQATDDPQTAAEVAHTAIMSYNLQAARRANGQPCSDEAPLYDVHRVNADRTRRALENANRGGKVEPHSTKPIDVEAQRWKDNAKDVGLIDERKTPG